MDRVYKCVLYIYLYKYDYSQILENNNLKVFEYLWLW